jgi:hypothetical protein
MSVAISGETVAQASGFAARIKYSASVQYCHCFLIQDNGEHDDADNDKYGDVLSPRHGDH